MHMFIRHHSRFVDLCAFAVGDGSVIKLLCLGNWEQGACLIQDSDL